MNVMNLGRIGAYQTDAYQTIIGSITANANMLFCTITFNEQMPSAYQNFAFA